MELTNQQKSAVEMFSDSNISLLHGAPGTGKTTVIKSIIERALSERKSVRLAAPTGKAAKRMSEATGYEAVTIHRLLEPYSNGETFQFKRNSDNPLECDVLILDEGSMITNSLMAAILKAVPIPNSDSRYNRRKGCKLLMAGDNYQLPSVGAGAVLRDLIESGKVPKIELTEIQRNTGDIVKACHAIKDGKIYNPSPKVDKDKGWNLRHIEVSNTDAITKTIDTVYDKMITDGYNPIWDVQCLSPVNGKYRITESSTDSEIRQQPLSCCGLNERLQQRLNLNPAVEGLLFREGDKVVNTLNSEADGADGKKTWLINGDMGTVAEIPDGKKYMICKFESPERLVKISRGKNNLLLAYCCTVHRYQGSECPVIIIPVHKSISYMIDRPWIYTAISRAQDICITVGQFEVIENAVKRVSNLNRKTFLQEKLRGE